jgi:toxin FitB
VYLLDTNILSLLDARRQGPASAMAEWMERNGSYLYLSAMTVAKMEAGILKLRRENKTQRAEELTVLLERILSDFGDRILPMDALVALTVTRLAEQASPSVVELADLITGATAKRHGLTVLTANIKHFGGLGISVVNPLETIPPDIGA